MNVVDRETRPRKLFSPLWKDVASVCNLVFQKFKKRPAHDLCKDYNKLLKQICEAHQQVYDLTTYECSNYPALVRGSSSTPVVGETVECTQVLVVYYLLRELLKRQINNISAAIQKDSIASYLDAQEQYTAGANMAKSIFTYLHWTWQKRGLPADHIIQPTEIVVGHLWMEVILTTEMKESLRVKVDEIVRRVRSGGCTTISEMEDVKRLSLNLGCSTDVRLTLYSSVIEETYLKSLTSFYNVQKASLKEGSIVEYITASLKAVRKEDVLARCFLMRSSYDQVSEAVLSLLIKDEKEYIFPFCKKSLSPSDGNDPLSSQKPLMILYKLLASSSEKIWMADALKESVAEYIDNELKKCHDISDASSVLLILKKAQRTFEATIFGIFGHQPQLINAVYDGVRVSLALYENSTADGEGAVKIAKRLTKFAAEEIKTVSIEELRSPNNWIALIYRLCSRQDVFNQFYIRLLQERLWMTLFVIGEQQEIVLREESLLSSLLVKDKNFGFIFTCKRMLTDVCRCVMRRPDRMHHPLMKPYILTAFAWGEPRRTVDSRGKSIPPEVQALISLNIHVYATLKNGRRLVFSSEYSGARMGMRVADGKLSLVVSFSQMRYLLVMNKLNVWTVSQLSSCTQTSEEECRRALAPFVHSLLLSESEENIFTVNPLLQAPPQGESKEYDLRYSEIGSQQTHAEKSTIYLRKERTHVLSIEGVVVRELKGRGALSLDEIIGGVSASLSGLSVLRRDIKKVLEKLVEREYVCRNENNVFSFIP